MHLCRAFKTVLCHPLCFPPCVLLLEEADSFDWRWSKVCGEQNSRCVDSSSVQKVPQAIVVTWALVFLILYPPQAHLWGGIAEYSLSFIARKLGNSFIWVIPIRTQIKLSLPFIFLFIYFYITVTFHTSSIIIFVFSTLMIDLSSRESCRIVLFKSFMCIQISWRLLKIQILQICILRISSTNSYLYLWWLRMLIRL